MIQPELRSNHQSFGNFEKITHNNNDACSSCCMRLSLMIKHTLAYQSRENCSIGMAPEDSSCIKLCKQIELCKIALLVFVHHFDVEREVENGTTSLLVRRYKVHKQIPYKSPWRLSQCTRFQLYWIRDQYTTSMTSRFVDPYQPPEPIPQVGYELSHRQYCGQGRIPVTSIGTFPTLRDAQDSTQDLLRTTLNQYRQKGWIGFYCNDINLEYRGLIAGYLSEKEHVYLSEIQLHAREKADHSVHSHLDGVEAWVYATGNAPAYTSSGHNTSHRTYVALAPTELLTQWRPASTYTPPQQEFSSYSGHTRGMESFSRTRPHYPDWPNLFVPRASAQYDEIMGFSTSPEHNYNTDPNVDTEHAREGPAMERHDRQRTL